MEPKKYFFNTVWEKNQIYNKKIFIDEFYGPEKVLQTNEKVKHCNNTDVLKLEKQGSIQDL